MRASSGQLDFFGGHVSTCRICGKLLTSPTSVAAGIGPICAARSVDRQADDGIGERPYDVYLPAPFLGDMLAFGRMPDGRIWSNVPHHVHTGKSPDGFEFGYPGSGPAEFGINIAQALLIMINYSGTKTAGRADLGGGWCFDLAYPLGQEIKSRFLSNIKRDTSDIRISMADLLPMAKLYQMNEGKDIGHFINE